HKPAGVDFMDIPGLVVPAARAEGDVSGVRLLKRHFHRLTPLMPIDAEASGLVVLSQDGRIWRRLTEDYAQIEQEFVVEVSGELGPYGLKRLAHGLEYRGRPLAPCKVSWQNETRLRFAIKNPQGGQLRHMCAQVGLQVVSSKRL
ncbi:RNA-binding protein, partial [Lysobacter sp. 2RAB21]